MELANCMLALGGDTGNTVPEYNVTPSEVMVLRLIHGEESVSEIDIVATTDRSHAAERDRLSRFYGRSTDGGPPRAEAVDALFPGAAARLFETFAEIGASGDDEPEEIEEKIVPIEKPAALAKGKKGKAAGKAFE